MRQPRRAALLASVLLGVCTAGVVLVVPAAAQSGCTNFSAVASADGVRVLSSAPGLSPTDADGAGPAAQALVNSSGISTAYAGAPYSEAAAGNAGAANVDATKVPVFAASSYPSAPNAGMSTPAFTLAATSDALASSAESSGGGASSQDPTVGRSSTTAASSCAEDGTVTAAGDNLVEATSFAAGVLRIGSVQSSAKVIVDSTGTRTLSGSMTVEGATVLGQAVSITDQGLVVGQSPNALPADPLAQALEGAGISVRTIAAVKDDARGQVLAPALEVTVTRAVPGFGTGPTETTYTFGRAFASASAVAGDATPPASSVAPSFAEIPSSPLTSGATNGSVTAAAPAAPVAVPQGSAPRSAVAPTTTAAIANASLASVYPALVMGAAVFAAAWLVFTSMGVKPRWR